MLSLPTLPSFFLIPESEAGAKRALQRVLRPLAVSHTHEGKLCLVSNRQRLEFQCGDRIKGFNPHRDYIEISVSRDEPHARISIEDRPDICGIRVLMNDTVIADIIGVRELDAGRIVLVPV